MRQDRRVHNRDRGRGVITRALEQWEPGEPGVGGLEGAPGYEERMGEREGVGRRMVPGDVMDKFLSS